MTTEEYSNVTDIVLTDGVFYTVTHNNISLKLGLEWGGVQQVAVFYQVYSDLQLACNREQTIISNIQLYILYI